MIQTVSFYMVSVLLVGSALMVVTRRSVLDSALFLAAALSMVAGIFVLLGADFLAAVQVLLYVGGILVILVFAVMLSSVQQSRSSPQTNEQWVPSLLACLGLLAVILASLKKSVLTGMEGEFLPSTVPLGNLLFGDLALPFEAVSLVLLASLAGAILFSRKESGEIPS